MADPRAASNRKSSPTTASALDILRRPDDWHPGTPSLIALVGDEPFLSSRILALLRERLCPDEADRSWAWREFNGDEGPDPRDVFDEAATIPLFAGATRAAVVRNADAFVSAARGPLEALADGPRAGRGLVILEVGSFPATTRLAKAVAKHGLAIETAIPPRYDLAGWLRDWAESRHGCGLAVAAAERLVERLGSDLGQIDQALARMAAAIPSGAGAAGTGRKSIPPEAIDDCVGSPQERTAWGMIDAAAAGNAGEAIAQLAALLDAGENPIGLTAQAATVLRRLSTAARLLGRPAGAGRPAGIEQALREAGVAAWPKAMAQAREAITQLGARRTRRLPGWLLELDRSLKGDASRGLRARLAIERLFCKMSRQAAAPAVPRRPERPRSATGTPGARP